MLGVVDTAKVTRCIVDYYGSPVPLEMESAFMQFETEISEIDAGVAFYAFADATVSLLGEYIPRYGFDRAESLLFVHLLYVSFLDSAKAGGYDDSTVEFYGGIYAAAEKVVAQSLSTFYDREESAAVAVESAPAPASSSSTEGYVIVLPSVSACRYFPNLCSCLLVC
jgi:hypothetical protein